MTRTHALTLAAIFALAGCQALQNVETLGDTQTALGKTASAVTTITDPNASTLSKAQAAACAAQALANALTDMLNGTGHRGDANNAAKLSTALGYGCTWTLPAS